MTRRSLLPLHMIFQHSPSDTESSYPVLAYCYGVPRLQECDISYVWMRIVTMQAMKSFTNRVPVAPLGDI